MYIFINFSQCGTCTQVVQTCEHELVRSASCLAVLDLVCVGGSCLHTSFVFTPADSALLVATLH